MCLLGLFLVMGTQYSNFSTSFPDAYNWINSPSCPSKTLEEYQREIEQNGECSFFGVDISTGTVRVVR